MFRYDWRKQIERYAAECEAALWAHARTGHPGALRAAESKASFAAWIARSYGWRYRARKFRR